MNNYMHCLLLLLCMGLVGTDDKSQVSTGKLIGGLSMLVGPLVVLPIISGIKSFRAPDTTPITTSSLAIKTFRRTSQKEVGNRKILTEKSIKEIDSYFRGHYRNNFHPQDEIAVKINGSLYHLESGVPKFDEATKRVIIVCDGFPCHSRPLLRYPYNLIKNLELPDPVVYFTFPTDHNRRKFDFCQEDDIKALELTINEVKKENKEASIILYGLCKGGTTVLHYLAQHHENPQVNAAIIESPPVSLQSIVSSWPLVHPLIRFIFPRYNPHGKTILDATHFPQIPLLFGKLPHDHIASIKDVNTIIKMIKELQENSDLITECEVTDKAIKHCWMTKSEEYRESVKKFLQKVE